MKSFFIISVLLFFISCQQQNENTDSLAGKWKPVGSTIRPIDSTYGKRIVHHFDYTNEDSIRRSIFNQLTYNLPPDKLSASDTALINYRADTILRNWRGAFLQLEKDLSFILVDNYLVIPDESFGVRPGDTLRGKWSSKDNTISLHITQGRPDITYKFLIIKQEKDSLILSKTPTHPKINEQVIFKKQ